MEGGRTKGGAKQGGEKGNRKVRGEKNEGREQGEEQRRRKRNKQAAQGETNGKVPSFRNAPCSTDVAEKNTLPAICGDR